MKIIGHRGAAGLALENTLESIEAALKLQVDAIECDVRRTKDKQLVILHDAHTGRVATKRLVVRDSTLAELQSVVLQNGHHIPSLNQVLSLVGNKTPLVLDIKDNYVHHELLRLLQAHPDVRISLTGRQYDEMHIIALKRNGTPFYVQNHFSPIEVIQTAKRYGATGISLNMWLMNPLTYVLAKRRGLKIKVYTVNHPYVMHFLKRLYPGIEVFTNHPQRYVAAHPKRTHRAKTT